MTNVAIESSNLPSVQKVRQGAGGEIITRIQALALLAVMSAFIPMSASAACGGGGWKSSSSSSTSTESKSLPPPPSEYADNSFDSNSFNRISGNLGLTSEQATSIIADMNGIRAAISALKNAQIDAHAAYAACKEKPDCDAKLQKFKDAVTAVKNYNAQKEFDTKLAKNLRAEQMETYKAQTSQSKLAQK